MAKYKYTVTDLEGNTKLVATSMHNVARFMGVSTCTVESRLKRRITKHDMARKKFNVTRKELR